MKILVAEDMTVARLVLDMALKKLGHEVVACADGEQAWNAIQREEYPLLITDCQMPKMDGLELCRKVRARPQARYTYIIMLTSHDTKVDYMAAIDAGADDFLGKPIEADMLAARLRVAERIGGMLSERQQYQGLLPICPICKRIRADNQWTKLEDYVATHFQEAMTQSQCPHCQGAGQETEQKLRAQMARLRHDPRKTP